MSSDILTIENLQVEFPGLLSKTPVLRGVDLKVEPGRILGLVGESGSGKSMTAFACLGMVPSPGRVTGSIKIDGEEIIRPSPREPTNLQRGTAAMVFQNPMRSLNPFFTIGQQMIEIVGHQRRRNKAEAKQLSIDALNSVQIPDPELALGKYPHQLSGGQIQRIMIALALACQPKLLIADEPTTALDVTVQAQIVSLIRQLVDETGLTVLFITHDLGVVSMLCDDVAVMYAGKCVESGSVSDVIDHSRHPYTERLISTVPRLGLRTTELGSIPGQVPGPKSLPSGCAFHNRCNQAVPVCSRQEPEFAAIDDRHGVACHVARDRQLIIEGAG